MITTPVDDEDPFEPAGIRAVPGRPSDHRDPWTLASTDQLHTIAIEAGRLAIHWATAITLVIESQLLERDLGGEAARALDAAARDVRLGAELAPADAVYLRSLRAGCVTRPTATVGLPARLATRILQAGGPDELLAAGELDRALAWETAAVATGRTMSEWALCVSLKQAQAVAAR